MSGKKAGKHLQRRLLSVKNGACNKRTLIQRNRQILHTREMAWNKRQKGRQKNLFPLCVFLVNSHTFAIHKTVIVAQLVRASDCGSEGRGFEPRHSPQKAPQLRGFLLGVSGSKSTTVLKFASSQAN